MHVKQLHFIWLNSELPDEDSARIDKWSTMYPDFEVVVHTDKPDWDARFDDMWNLAPNVQTQADIMRYWLMLTVGGIYADTDTEPIRTCIDEYKQGAFATEIIDLNGEVFQNNFFLGSPYPGDELWTKTLDLCERRLNNPGSFPHMPCHFGVMWEEAAEDLDCNLLLSCINGTGCREAFVNHFPRWFPEEVAAEIISGDEEAQRLAICNACEFLTGERCAKCGCSGRHRSRIATVHCPIDKW